MPALLNPAVTFLKPVLKGPEKGALFRRRGDPGPEAYTPLLLVWGLCYTALAGVSEGALIT